MLQQREEELIFLGMSPKNDNYNNNLKDKNQSYIRRKQVQLENREDYENALESLKERIIIEEGAETRDELRKDRTSWITDRIAQAKFPDNLDQYYTAKQSGYGTGTGINQSQSQGQGVDSSAEAKSDNKDNNIDKDKSDKKGSKGSKRSMDDKEKDSKSDIEKGKDKGKEKAKGKEVDVSAMSKPQPKSEVGRASSQPIIHFTVYNI